MPLDFGCVAPEQFEIVEFSKFVVEEMDDDIDKIDDGPSALLEAGRAKGGSAILFAEGFYFLGDRSDLLGTGSGTDDEMFGDRATVGQLQDNDVGAMAIVGQLGYLSGQVTAGFQIIRGER